MLPTLPNKIANVKLSQLLEHLEPHTQRSYRQGLIQFGRWLVQTERIRDEKDPDRLLASAGMFLFSRHPAEANLLAAEWFRSMLEPGPDGVPKYTRGTVSNRRSALLWACKKARQIGLITWQLEASLPKSIKNRHGQPSIKPGRDMHGPSLDEVKRLWAHLNAVRGPKICLARAIVALILFETLREHEIRQLDYPRNVRDMKLEVVRKKRSEPEVVHVSTATWRAINTWLDMRGRAPGPLFVRLDVDGLVRIGKTRIYDLLRDLGEELGFQRPLSPHRLRHTAITLGDAAAQAAGISTAARMKRSGHKNPAVYLRYVDDTEVEAQEISEHVAHLVLED